MLPSLFIRRLVKHMLRALLLAALLCPATGALAVPSTFSPVIGNRLLCLTQQDSAYFHDYLTEAFGPAYKREGGALWFKAPATLWGAQMSEVMVSDRSDTMNFLGAVFDLTPDKLEEAVTAGAGQRFKKMDGSAYPVRESSAGSRIVYFKGKSKIYCAKSRYAPPS